MCPCGPKGIAICRTSSSSEEEQVQEDPLLLLLEEGPGEEVDADLNEISLVASVAKRRKKYVLEDSDSD